jgi:tRNA (guanosine-2'-O-)-methyltransferase
MIDIDYLNFLENILTDNRKEKFLKCWKTGQIISLLWKIFSDAQYQCSDAQLRGFGIQELNVIEQRYKKVLIRKLPWVPRNGSILMRLTAFLIV